jgi:hypothetical protein
MAGPQRLNRSILEKISPDHRWIRMMEQLLDLIPSDNESIQSRLDEVHVEAGSAMARAQLAVDMLSVRKAFGEFFSTIDQTGSAVDTPTLATLNSTVVETGMSMSSSRITVDKKGTYKVNVRIQL